MAAPWSVLFSAIPWSDVIAHAPTVAKGAKKLWQKVGKRPAADAPADVPMEAPGASPEAPGQRIFFFMAWLVPP